MTTEFNTISRDDLAERIQRESPDNDDRQRGFALVNVLAPQSFVQSHIPGSINIPQGQEDLFEQRFDKGKEIIVYCASFDCSASPKAATELARRGFTDVYDYEGGMQDWQERSAPPPAA